MFYSWDLKQKFSVVDFLKSGLSAILIEKSLHIKRGGKRIWSIFNRWRGPRVSWTPNRTLVLEMRSSSDEWGRLSDTLGMWIKRKGIDVTGLLSLLNTMYMKQIFLKKTRNGFKMVKTTVLFQSALCQTKGIIPHPTNIYVMKKKKTDHRREHKTLKTHRN